jgi:hypothetical protein
MTPVAFIIFNRPEATRRVLEEIRKARPKQLFVIADAPRPDRVEDIAKCAATRAIIDEVDWDCEVFKNYAEENLGCGLRPASGLDWVFQQVETAIVLEDDCLPHPTFFPYCTELLDRYRDEPRVMHISGNNFQFGRRRGDDSYFFSRYTHHWGWATWRRAWQHFDYDIPQWSELRSSDWLTGLLDTPAAVSYWHQIFDQVYNGDKLHIWDYQWTFACWLNAGLSILPQVDLVSNIGFNSDGTHTIRHNEFADLPLKPIVFPLQHPSTIKRDRQADIFSQTSKFNLDLWSRLKRKFYWHRLSQLTMGGFPLEFSDRLKSIKTI